MTRRVLYVDDDPEVRDLTATQLERRGDDVDVITASGATAAAETLWETAVDCVVADHSMPDATGLDLLDVVRDEHPHLPFVLFTGRGSESVASEAISKGVTDYVEKGSADRYELLAKRIEDALEQHRIERELHETNRTLAALHESAVDLASAEDQSLVVDRTLDVAEEILDFDVYGLYELVDGRFEPRTDRSFHGGTGLLQADEGLIGQCYETGESVHVRDVADEAAAEPASDTFRSALSVPVGDFGVFQAISQRPGAFDDRDLEMAELLLAHTEQALERIAQQASLRETNERLQAILDNTTAVVYVKDLDGRYTLVNERYLEVLEMDRQEVLGKTDYEVQERKYAEEVRANDERAIEERSPVEVEERAYHGGRERIYYSVKVPIVDDDGDPRAVCGISSDITNLKDRERELERQNDRLDDFAAVVSHDLRNPLGVARGYLDLVRAESDDDRLAEVEHALDRMEQITEDLLTLAKEGDTIGETTTVSMADVAREAWGNVSTESASLTVDGDRTVEGDRSRLLQAFENLFRNSIEHGATEPSIRVGTTDDGVFVEDDGPGFPDGTSERALKPGFSTSDGGTGFGLAIVDSIAEAHGWTVYLTNGRAGGARVEIVID